MILKPVLLTTILSIVDEVDTVPESNTLLTSFLIGILTSIVLQFGLLL